MHANTAALIRDLGLQYLHVFPYSPRPGTPAARMPQVPGDARKARAAELRAIGAENLTGWLDSRIGGTDRVLIERDGVGRGESFAEIRVSGGAVPGEIVDVTLTGRDGTILTGERTARAAA
jgi:threonylcarbamoyladenosine tRNA methylthiotransferase MtaB